MKKSEVLNCLPLPCRGSRKSVNWAPQFSPPAKGKLATIRRTSSRLSSQGSASPKPHLDCNVLKNSSKETIGSTEDQSDKEEAPTRIVSYTGRRGKRQKTGAAGRMEQKKARKCHPKSRTVSNVKLRSGGPEIVPEIFEDRGEEDRTDGDRATGKEGKLWFSGPPTDVESVVNTRTRYRRECQKANQDCVRVSNNETPKSDVELEVAISNGGEVCAKIVEDDRAKIDEETLDALRVMVTGLEGVLLDVGHLVQNLQERNLQRIHAETAEYEATAATERQELRDEITKLKRKNITVESEKSRIKRERDRLKKDYVGMLDKSNDVQRLKVDIETAEASAAALTEELAKEIDKSSCQICFNNPRDVIVLPCMHFQYCNQCVQMHQQRNAECPTCRGKINGLLRCNVSTS